MRLITKEETKARLEQYAGLRLELHNRLQQLARLQQADRDRPLLTGSRAEEYARRIAGTVQRNRRELAEVEAAVTALTDPIEREVLRLRYMASETCRPMPWAQVADNIMHRYDQAVLHFIHRAHKKALQHLTDIWQKSEQ